MLRPMHFHTQLKLRLLISLCCLVMPAKETTAASFKTEGWVQQLNGSNIVAAYAFSVRVRDCSWYVRTTPKQGSIQYYEDAFDGKQTYHYAQFSGKPVYAVNSSVAVVQLGEIPDINAYYVIPTWLAYCSGCYFRTVSGNEIAPILSFGDPDINSRDKRIQVDWEPSRIVPFVPKRIYYEKIKRIYSVVTFTNFGDLLLPKEFLLESYPLRGTLTNSPIFTLHGYVTNVAVLDPLEQIIPELDGKTYTEDRRFASLGVRELHYNNTNGKWLETNNAALIALYKQKRGELPLEPHRFPTVLVIMGLSTLAFLFLIVRLRSHGTQNDES